MERSNIEKSLWESFCNQKGAERVDITLSYLLHKPVPSSFYENLSSVGSMINKDWADWGYFKGAVAKVFGEEYLSLTSRLGKSVVISGPLLVETIKTLPIGDLRIPDFRTAFKLTGEKGWYVCPDITAVKVRGKGAKLHAVCQSKATLTAGSRSHEDTIRRTLSNQKVRDILQDAIGQIVGVSPDQVEIPKVTKIPVILIAMQKGPENILTYKRQTGTEVVGIADMETFSFRVLRTMVQQSRLVEQAVSQPEQLLQSSNI